VRTSDRGLCNGGRDTASRALMMHGLLAWPVEGRAPARQHLGARRRVSAPNTDGWREILPRQEEGHASATAPARARKLKRFPHISAADASTASPSHTAWRLAGYLGVASAAAVLATSLGTVISLRRCRSAGAGLASLVPTTDRPPITHPSTVHQPQMGPVAARDDALAPWW
jgi:hypothetical protein